MRIHKLTAIAALAVAVVAAAPAVQAQDWKYDVATSGPQVGLALHF